MSLPSQSARPMSRRSHMYKRTRPSKRWILFILVPLAVALAGWWWFTGGDEDPSDAEPVKLTSADPARSESASQPPRKPTRQPGTPSKKPEPAKQAAKDSRIEMGARNAAPNPATSLATIETPRETSPPPASHTPTPSRSDSAAASSSASTTTTSRAKQRMDAGFDLIAANQPLEARRALSDALALGELSEQDTDAVRSVLAQLSDQLVFSPQVVPGDAFVETYVIKPGDSLVKISKNLPIDWRFVQRINGIRNPQNIRAGQRLKLITSPFHAVVNKRDFRLDLYLGNPDNQVFVRSFTVGLGEYDSTPVGLFKLREGSKEVNPAWVNPRTREAYGRDDPDNPIGDYWIGLQGVSENVKDMEGYGIHGTIEPDSIGTQQSMGCVRMLPDDIELVFEVLTIGNSLVEIRP